MTIFALANERTSGIAIAIASSTELRLHNSERAKSPADNCPSSLPPSLPSPLPAGAIVANRLLRHEFRAAKTRRGHFSIFRYYDFDLAFTCSSSNHESNEPAHMHIRNVSTAVMEFL